MPLRAAGRKALMRVLPTRTCMPGVLARGEPGVRLQRACNCGLASAGAYMGRSRFTRTIRMARINQSAAPIWHGHALITGPPPFPAACAPVRCPARPTMAAVAAQQDAGAAPVLHHVSPLVKGFAGATACNPCEAAPRPGGLSGGPWYLRP